MMWPIVATLGQDFGAVNLPMNTLLLSVASVIGGLLAVLLILAVWSRFGQAPGRVDGALSPCPGTPNCLCSEAGTDAAHALAPLPLPQADDVLAVLRAAVEAEGGEIVVMEDDYLAARFRTPLLGFVDDLELRVDREAQVVQARSASRVGYSDGGLNRRRVATLRQRLMAGH